jgi:hypothetical protein
MSGNGSEGAVGGKVKYGGRASAGGGLKGRKKRCSQQWERADMGPGGSNRARPFLRRKLKARPFPP